MCTDSGAKAEDGIYSEEKSHPRAWGSAPRILGRYVRDEKLLTLEEAVRKMTSLPASRMGLADRGVLRPGMAADVVLFDPATVARSVDVRRPAALQRRNSVRDGERGARRRRGTNYVSASGPPAEGAGIPQPGAMKSRDITSSVES